MSKKIVLGSLEIPVIDYDADELGHELDSSDWISEYLRKKTQSHEDSCIKFV